MLLCKIDINLGWAFLWTDLTDTGLDQALLLLCSDTTPLQMIVAPSKLRLIWLSFAFAMGLGAGTICGWYQTPNLVFSWID